MRLNNIQTYIKTLLAGLLAFISPLFSATLQEPLKLTIPTIESSKTKQIGGTTYRRLDSCAEFRVGKTRTLRFPAMDLKIGETGVVIHTFNDNYKSAIASVEIISIEDGRATAKILPATILPQKYLPLPRICPVVGDEIYFRLFNNNAFLIAPTLESYEQIRDSRNEVNFLNSDLMMGYLLDKGGFDPKPAFLNKVCQIYNAGLLYVLGTNNLYILDCQSLVVLDSISIDTSDINETAAPFFSRIQHISSGDLDSSFRKKRSREYFRYYDALIAEGSTFKSIEKSKTLKKPKEKTANKKTSAQDSPNKELKEAINNEQSNQ